MKKKSSALIILIILGCFLTVVLAVLAFVPFLNEVFSVQVAESEVPKVTVAPIPEKPEEVPVTVYYIMEEESKKISEIYIEVFHTENSSVFYMEVPSDTRVNLSEDLYKSLQSYAPELPRYFKLSNMAESFSEEYGLTGCNRILSEVLGMSLTEYVRTDAATMAWWLALQKEESSGNNFFTAYTEWLAKSLASRSEKERWMYYESRQKVSEVVTEIAPGTEDKDGYLISGKRSKERLEELKFRRETAEQE